MPSQINFLKFLSPPEKNPETGKMERNYCPVKETIIIVKRGELIAGSFNKSIVGSASGGLVHIIWKECGPKVCADFLSNSQLLIN